MRSGLAAADDPLPTRSRGVEPYEAQVAAIGELLTAGKIRAWGLSNENAEGVGEFIKACDAAGVDRPVCVQNAYSLVQRGDETALIDLLEEHKVGCFGHNLPTLHPAHSHPAHSHPTHSHPTHPPLPTLYAPHPSPSTHPPRCPITPPPRSSPRAPHPPRARS